MSNLPDCIMYAIVSNSIVIDCAIEIDNQIVSPLTKKTYIKDNNFQFVQMTLENSPAEVGMLYKNNKFIKE